MLLTFLSQIISYNNFILVDCINEDSFFFNGSILGNNRSVLKMCLFFLLTFPLFCMFFIFFADAFFFITKRQKLNTALYLSATSFLSSILMLCFINTANASIQGILAIPFTPFENTYFLYFGVDAISASLIILTNLFIYLCILSIRFEEIKGKYSIVELLNKLFFIQWGLLCAFTTLDLFGFFIFFEATLIPMFAIILQGGSRERKARASYLIALYTIFGSIFMLFNIAYLQSKYGTTNYLILYESQISTQDQKILWLTFFLAFATKIPVFPFHLWLPEAHVEAPTIGSVLLAALLLKLGIFGMIRFGLPLFPYGQEYFKHIIVILTLCSFFYTSLTAIRQVDIKKIIAYSSVVHMNLIVLGILCISVESLDGAIFQMLAHGIVSGALFFCIGIIYERVKSRFLWYYGGLAFIMPLYSLFLFIFLLANISFPTTSNFIGEMLLFMGIFKDNFIIGFFAIFSMFWGAIFNIWTYNRMCFGNLKFNFDKNAKHLLPNSNISAEVILTQEYKDALAESEAEFRKKAIKKDPLFLIKEEERLLKEKQRLIKMAAYERSFEIRTKNKDIDFKDFYILFLLTFLLFLTGIYSSSILNYISIVNQTIVNHVEFIFSTNY